MADIVLEDAVDDDNWDDVYNNAQPTSKAVLNLTQGEQRSNIVQSSVADSNRAAVQVFAGHATEPVMTNGHPIGSAELERTDIDREDEDIPSRLVSESTADAKPSQDSPRTTTTFQPQDVVPNPDAMLDDSTPTAQEPNEQNLNASALTMQAVGEPMITEVEEGTKSGDAEFEFGDSDSDSDSSTLSSDSSDDSEYSPLDAETLAKMLMAGDDHGDDSEAKSQLTEDKNFRPFTANESREEAPPRPDIVITPNMKVEYLGKIESVVEQTLLIRGVNSGEFQVLEGGSLLCTMDRKVIGVVAETLGRVKEPMYSVLLGHDYESLLQELGLTVGSAIAYVDEYSPKVFTNALIGEKGTDASNLFDEEVNPDEVEFSDDEKEAAFKRLRKQNKKKGLGVLSRSTYKMEHSAGPVNPSTQRRAGRPSLPYPPPPPAPTTTGSRPPSQHTSISSQQTTAVPRANNNFDAPGQTYGKGLNYDDDDEPYQPLKRPDNLTQMMQEQDEQSSKPVPPWMHSRDNRRGGDRGRGARGGRNARGRGRGDRAGQASSQPSNLSHNSFADARLPSQTPLPAAAPTTQVGSGTFGFGNTATVPTHSGFHHGPGTQWPSTGQQPLTPAFGNQQAVQHTAYTAQPPQDMTQWMQYYAAQAAQAQYQQQYDRWQQQYQPGQNK